jgi:excisionase family DNA binding protein
MAHYAASHDPLLTLKQAAQRLSVHPATLRRWADQGDILVVLTPGGHRRFPRSEVERLASTQQGSGKDHALQTTLAQQALSHTRAELAEHRDESWMTRLDEKAREQQRQMGRRVMGLMMQYISVNDDGADLLEEARSIGHTYAEVALQTGLGLTETLQAMMFFRENVVESVLLLPNTVHIRPETNQRLLRQVNIFLNAILQGVTETYEA